MAIGSKTSRKTIFVTLLFVLYAGSDVVAIRQHLARVYTTNGLEGGKNLTMHCKSKDDDLGIQVLTPGATWMFKFHPNWFMWGQTLFFCRFSWEGIDYRYFDIYIQQRDDQICHDCCWTIKADGPCSCPCGRACDFNHCLPWKPRKTLIN